MRKQIIAIVSIAFCMTGLGPAVAAANSLRCGNLLVLNGDTRDAVSVKCGPPTDISRSAILRRASYARYGRMVYATEQAIETPVETWVYNFGPNRFMMRLRFVDGVLEGIETLGYGYNDNR